MTGKVVRFSKQLPAIIVAYIISLSAFGYAYNTNTNQLEAQKRQTEELERQNNAIAAQNAALADLSQRQRKGLCGLQVYLAVPANPNPSQSNTTFRDVISRLTGPESLNCSPNPNDGE